MLPLICYLVCGFVVGGLNSVAGGGAFILFPVLMAVGLSPVMANTTMSLIVLPGSASSVFGYLSNLQKLKSIYFWLIIPCAIGSLIGAAMLVNAPGNSFEHVVPFFMAFASLLLVVQPLLHRIMYRRRVLSRHHLIAVGIMAIAFLILSAYGGYFGAGFGVIVLGLLGLTPIRDLQQLNGLKNLTALSVGAVDCSYFIAHHVVDWSILPLFMLGNLLGGYVASIYGSRLPAAKLRLAMVVVAVGVTVYTFVKFGV